MKQASPSSENHWRSLFRNHRLAVEKAERNLERAEAVDTTMRAGASRTAGGVHSRWGRAQRHEDRMEARIERAEESVRKAEDKMHELRQRAVASGVPDAWMR